MMKKGRKASKGNGTLIVPPFLFIIILTSILLTPFLLHPTTIPEDGYPEGSLVIPTMVPPVFDGTIDSDWNDALKIDVVFAIPQTNDPQTYRDIEATFYFGHDNEYLFEGYIIHSAGLNPYTGTDMQGYSVHPDFVHLFFDVDGDHVLSFPEDGKSSLVFLAESEGHYYISDGFPLDLFYGQISNSIHLGSQEILWNSDDNWAGGEGGTTFDPHPGWYAGSTNDAGDEIIEISIPLRSDDPTDGLNLEAGKVHLLGMCIEFNRQGSYEEGASCFDDWPGEGFTPDVCVHPEQYADIVIDLT